MAWDSRPRLARSDSSCRSKRGVYPNRFWPERGASEENGTTPIHRGEPIHEDENSGDQKEKTATRIAAPSISIELAVETTLGAPLLGLAKPALFIKRSECFRAVFLNVKDLVQASDFEHFHHVVGDIANFHVDFGRLATFM